MKSKNIIMWAIVATLLICPMVSEASDASSATTVNGLTLSTFDDHIDVAAGNSTTISIMMTNNSADYISASVKVDSGSGYSCSIDSSEYLVSKDSASKCVITVDTNRFAEHGDYVIKIAMNVFNFSTGTAEETTMNIDLTIEPRYDDGSEYNKIFGIFGPLPEPFNTPLVSSLITLAIWCMIAGLAYVILRSIWARVFKDSDDDRKDITRTTGWMIVIAITLVGIRKSLVVYGANDAAIGIFQDIPNLIFVILGTIFVWSVYKNLITTTFHRLERDGKLTTVDSTLVPLFHMIGKVIIAIGSVSALLSVLGMDLMAILTGAGLVGVAVSLGAQGILTEFFGGVTTLVTRPFKVGDMVQIGSENNIYEVKRIGFLNCEFKNWINLERYIIPNSVVSTSTIVNITGRTSIYRIFLYFDVDYDAPIERTKEIILDGAYANKDVVTDDDRYKPFVRLDSFDYSYMTFRLAVYIKDFRDNVRLTGELNEAIYAELVKEGIDCPFEIYDVYVKDETKDE